jgi:XTP/dITP diphosphohydrolase
MKPLLLASTNRGKLIEIQDLLPGFQLLLPKDIGLTLEVEETGSTYAENAGLKARAYQAASRAYQPGGLTVLADDSGLAVACLNGAPGLHSARYSSKPGATDALLENLSGGHFPRPWLAHFHCTVALAAPHAGNLLFADGDCPGEIIPAERGSNGFGYDPIFLLPDLGLTMAELSRAQKNTLSHRARAIQAALPLLARLLAD